jgi:hypothetical protein
MRSMMPAGRPFRSLVTVVAVVLSGCASKPSAPPPAPLAPPVAGESPQQIIARGYRIAPVFRFVSEEHQYAFATAYSAVTGHGLILIDGALACTFDFDQTGPGLPEWQWVAEPDGLSYMASRMSQVCGLEPETTPRCLPGDPESRTAGNVGTGAETSDQNVPMVAEVLGGAVGMTIGLLWGPLFWIPLMAAEAGTSAADGAALHRLEQADVALSAEQMNERLGKPDVSFPLPKVATTVYEYPANEYYRIYLGVKDGKVIWVRTGFPWLDDLARQAKTEQKRHK